VADRRAVCVREASAWALIGLRAAGHRPTTVVVGGLPRYGKALHRWLRIPERWLYAAYSLLAGVPVRAGRAVALDTAATRRIGAGMRLVGRIVVRLTDDLGQAGWTRALAAVLGPEAATAYFQRRFAWDDIWPEIRAVVLGLDHVADGRPAVLWSSLWPDAWVDIVAAELAREFGVEVIRAPERHRRALQAAVNGWWAAVSVGHLAGAIIRHGVRVGRRPGVTAAIEFISPDRFGGGPADTNFIEPDRRIAREEILYYLTPEQGRHYRREGKSAEAAVAAVRRQGFAVVDLRRQAYAPAGVALLGRLAAALLIHAIRPGAACLAQSGGRGVADIAAIAALFGGYRPSNVLHTFTPNGDASLRLDSAVVTALSRRFGARAVGYQNRITYDSVFEDAFDCYDLYLAWGAGWRDVLPGGSESIKRLAVVGCTENDGRPARRPRSGKIVRVSVFTNELTGRHSRENVVRLLAICVGLADHHPRCRFTVKTKDPEDVAELAGDPALLGSGGSMPGNLTFVRRARHDLGDLIADADIVIASAWTTPGGLALVMDKRVIFFDPLESEGGPFTVFPDMIASSSAEMHTVFGRAVEDYDRYAEVHREAIDRLDPFRDGRARERIVDELLAADPG
jgi:hypothetical protein